MHEATATLFAKEGALLIACVTMSHKGGNGRVVVDSKVREDG